MSYKYRIDLGTGRLNDPRLYKGGGGDAAYYKEANRLYGKQADTAEFMLNIGKQYLPGATADYAAQTQKFFDQGYEDRMAGKAGQTAQSAIDQNNDAMRRDMARYGINPASGKWSSAANTAAIQGSALKAGAINQARDAIENKRFGVAKDFYSNLVGMPSDAAAMAGQAASGMAGIGANKAAAEQQESAGWGQAIGLGAQAFGMFKDGGQVEKKPEEPSWRQAMLRKMLGYGLAGQAADKIQPDARKKQLEEELRKQTGYKDGGCVGKNDGVRLFRGGMAGRGGLFTANNYQAPPQPVPQQGGGMGQGLAQGLRAGSKVKDAVTGAGADKLLGGMSRGLSGIADTTGISGVAETALGAAGAGGEQAAMLVAQNAGLDGATALTSQALGAGTAAAGEAAAIASPALAGVATALPWIGAAAAVGSMLGLFADGGEVKRHDATDGGEVKGPGTETSDDVPAWLSTGEFVVNAEAVKAPGVKEMLEHINDAGLRKREAKEGEPKFGIGGYLGSFAGGLAGGYQIGQGIKNAKEDRELRRQEHEFRKQDQEIRRQEAEDRKQERELNRTERERLAGEREARKTFDQNYADKMAQAEEMSSGKPTYLVGEEGNLTVWGTKDGADKAAQLNAFIKQMETPSAPADPTNVVELRRQKIDGDNVFYNNVWPKMRAEYAKIYGLDKALEHDKTLREASLKNMNTRIMEALALERSGDKAGAVKKWSESFNRDVDNGLFTDVELQKDGNVRMVMRDQFGKTVDDKTVPYPNLLAIAKGVVGSEQSRLETIVKETEKEKGEAETKMFNTDVAAAYKANKGRMPSEGALTELATKHKIPVTTVLDAFAKLDASKAGAEAHRANAEQSRAAAGKYRADADATKAGGGGKPLTPSDHMARLKYGTEQLQLMFGVKVDSLTGKMDGTLADKAAYAKSLAEVESRIRAGEEPGAAFASVYERVRRGSAVDVIKTPQSGKKDYSNLWKQ